MIASRSRLAARLVRRQAVRAFGSTPTAATASASANEAVTERSFALAVGVAAACAFSYDQYTHLDLISTGTPVKEPGTGILFPQLCNGLYFAGCGYRVKYGFFKVYAVGTYMDPLSLGAVKTSSKEAIEEALLDPTYPRTIRIVMNRNLSSEKFIAAIVESLEPRMMGQDLDA